MTKQPAHPKEIDFVTPDPILLLEHRLDLWTKEAANISRDLAALKTKAPPEPLPTLGEVGRRARWRGVRVRCDGHLFRSRKFLH